MPLIDLNPNTCAWCGLTDISVFLCPDCHMYTCKECRVAVTEEGCVHKKKSVPESKNWNDD